MSTYNEKIETFSELAVIDSLDLADRLTSAFEEIGIPVLLEHIGGSVSGETSSYRISTQTQYLENAKRIADSMINVYDTRRVVTIREKIT